MAALKRHADDDLLPPTKIQRIEHPAPPSPLLRQPNSDFSGSVKKRLADSKRTGQACDRCKIRKIRCDGRPEGCTPCEQNRTACRTTDRITGRATVRGHAEAMESENAYLRSHIADLQAQLKDLGVEPRAPPACNSSLPTPSHPWSSAASESTGWSDAGRRTSSASLPGGHVPSCSGGGQSEAQTLPQFKYASIGDNYLGVAAGDPLLSHIRGTSLSLFGTDINITDFVMDEAEYESSPMSYTSLVKIALGTAHVKPPSPLQYKDLREYAVWYLRSLNPYTMLVHKPEFMDLIWRFGNDPSFVPSSAEKICVHMMLATIMYQIAARNSQSTALLQQSHAHYQYALSFFKPLLAEQHTWRHVQALAMICHHLRNFPKPGAAWIMTSLTYLFAIELGLHRSVKAWADETQTLPKIEIEMRKRVFWTLNALSVNLNGKLGRPMPISNEDIDVEFPEPMSDCLPGEESTLDAFHRCSFQVGIQIAKYTVWELELYKTVYAVRYSARGYVDNLKRLQAGIQQWKDELPPELRDPSQSSADDHIFSLYLEYWHQSYNILLHHPAVCRSTDAMIVSSNLDKCMDASRKMLLNCTKLMQKKSLDIPWINAVVYVAAAFTTLFISTVRKEDLSAVDMTKLKDDMAVWIEIIGKCDQFLSSGNRLKGAISHIVDQSLAHINESIVKRAATESLAHVALQTSQQPSPVTPMYDSNAYRDYSVAGTTATDPALTSQTPVYNGMTAANSHPYNLGNPISVPPPPTTPFDSHAYSTVSDADMAVGHVAALAAAANNPPELSSDGYPYAHVHMTSGAQQPVYQSNYAQQDWRQWTRTYTQMGQPGEYLNTATTLMTLGRDGAPQGSGNETQGLVDTTGAQGHVAHHWPEIVFPGGAGHMGQH
ncbi:hypothetical protein ACN47E_000984 [Coniothyrium glycines]